MAVYTHYFPRVIVIYLYGRGHYKRLCSLVKPSVKLRFMLYVALRILIIYFGLGVVPLKCGFTRARARCLVTQHKYAVFIWILVCRSNDAPRLAHGVPSIRFHQIYKCPRGQIGDRSAHSFMFSSLNISSIFASQRSIRPRQFPCIRCARRDR